MSLARPPPWSRMILLAAALAPACTLVPPESSPRPAYPDREIAPWLCGELSLCLGPVCDDAIGATVGGADLYVAAGALHALVELGGAIYGGPLDESPRLTLDPRPLLGAVLPWQGEGLRDPDRVEVDGGALIFFGVADGSAIGVATLADGVLRPRETPLWRATDLGGTRVDAPTGLWHDDELYLALAVDHTEIRLARGAGLESLSLPLPAFTAATVAGDNWTEISRLDGPELRRTGDGVLGLFFSAAAHGPPAGDDAPWHESIGYAGSSDGRTWEMFSGNPVLDCTVSFILHGDEAAPTVADAGAPRTMLYRSTTAMGRRLALATHPE